MTLDIRSITRAYDGGSPALDDVNLTVREGEFLALLGPSGSGKTTLLRIMAGLDRPTRGQVSFNGEDFLALSPRERRVGMVFQSYALFRHMTVADNIAFGLKVRPRGSRPSRADIARRVDDLLRLIQLEGYGSRFPSQLSGGQRQRVALARALAIEPRLLLLDEPFGALDARVRRDLRRWLRDVHEQTGVTTVLVTHDQEEALELADRVAILKDGRIEQIDAPQALYEHPASAFVHDFLGEGLQLRAVVDRGEVVSQDWRGAAPADAPAGDALLCIRPEDLEAGDGGLVGVVMSNQRRGDRTRVAVSLHGRRLELDRCAADPLAGLQPGAPVRLVPRRFHLLSSDRSQFLEKTG
ncbi:sulfate/molybdate ABC transporter ATP-binding protein [Brevundimonas faecalis]|uniref:Sulfate transport system ATP-binding protein n=1 Tax=Brevundimonas faecalis TaxID=947378 RepID=A0ABV2RB32_9CAUL